MPTITVVVQRQWSIAPMLSVSNPNTTLLNPITAKIGEKEMRQRARTVVSEAYGPNKTLLRSGRQQFNKEDAALMRELKELPGDILMNGTNYKRKTSLLTQLTDPTLIARFVSFYNTTKDPKYLKECEVQAREMIRRLKHLALNIIQDTADDVEEKVKEYSHTKDADIENPVYNQNLGKMRGKKYGASGRHIHESADTILKLMENSQKMKKTTYEFGCKAQKSLAIFLGLENDIFKTDILTTILRSLDEGDAVTDPALVKEEIDSLIVLVREMEHNFNHDFALQVNSRRKEDRAEKYLQCIVAALERLSFGRNIVPEYEVDDFNQHLQTVLESLEAYDTDNPYHNHLILSAFDVVRQLISPKEESSPGNVHVNVDRIALNFLTQSVRMKSPKDLSSHLGAFQFILEELIECDRYLGQRIIKYLSTAAASQPDVCELYIELLEQTAGLNWHWHFLMVLTCGVIVIKSSSSVIRKMAMQDGVLKYLKSNDPRIRLASFMCLVDIFYALRNHPLGHICLKIVDTLKENETDHNIQRFLSKNRLSPDLTHNKGILSGYFKLSLTLAEVNMEADDRLNFLIKYLEVTDRNVKPPSKKALAHERKRSTAPTTRTSQLNQDYLKHLLFTDSLPALSPEAYHHTFRLPGHAEYPPALAKTSLLTVKGSYRYEASDMHDEEFEFVGQPKQGSLNRRKLYNAPLMLRKNSFKAEQNKQNFVKEEDLCLPWIEGINISGLGGSNESLWDHL